MIFLDYRACGPQGEPAVVHVDQENDYKITHLADSFEEFIRGLEHESLYDPDEDVEDLEDDADEEETDHKGSFAGSVLLSKAEWDKEQLIRDLREEWGIVDEEPDEGDEDVENSDDAVVMRVGNMMLIVTLFHGHIPDNEAEINAENNYMWPEAVEVAKGSEFLHKFLPDELSRRYYAEALRRCEALKNAADPIEYERVHYFNAI